MSDLNLAIRMTKESQLQLAIGFGCMLALSLATGESANAQVVQAASERRGELLSPQAQLMSGQSGRFSTRRVLIQFPQTVEPSPSDAGKDSDDKDDQQSSDEKKDDEKSFDNFGDEKSDTGNGADKKEN